MTFYILTLPKLPCLNSAHIAITDDCNLSQSANIEIKHFRFQQLSDMKHLTRLLPLSPDTRIATDAIIFPDDLHAAEARVDFARTNLDGHFRTLNPTEAEIITTRLFPNDRFPLDPIIQVCKIPDRNPLHVQIEQATNAILKASNFAQQLRTSTAEALARALGTPTGHYPF